MSDTSSAAQLARLQQRTVKIAAIAKQAGIDTLTVRNSDSLDFHDIAVWSLEAMLITAYEQGRTDAKAGA